MSGCSEYVDRASYYQYDLKQNESLVQHVQYHRLEFHYQNGISVELFLAYLKCVK
jgi:hypothetical protein